MTQCSPALLEASKTAIACLELFESTGEFTILRVPEYAPDIEHAHNVRNAHVRAAREAKRILEEALGLREPEQKAA
jgi:hypothetical protein